MEGKSNKQKGYLVLAVGILALAALFFAFHRSSPTRQQAKIVSKVERSTQRKGSSISLNEAKRHIESQAKTELSGTKYRLGKIKALHIDKTGKATSWTFTYIYSKPGDDKHIYEKSLRWYKGEIKAGVEQKIFKPGLNTPDYDYLFKEVGEGWAKPEEIIKKAIKIYGREDKTTGYGLYLYWQTDISKNAPVYIVDPYFVKEKKLYFNAKTGENLPR